MQLYEVWQPDADERFFVAAHNSERAKELVCDHLNKDKKKQLVAFSSLKVVPGNEHEAQTRQFYQKNPFGRKPLIKNCWKEFLGRRLADKEGIITSYRR